MILISSDKKELPILEIKNLHSELNNYFISYVYYCQHNSKQYQDILTKYTKILSDLYNLIQDIQRFNNNNNNNNQSL